MAEDEGFEPPRESPHLSVFKTDPFNQAWVIFLLWCFLQDSNLQPTDYESGALTN